ncbi:MAG: hypothetical protein JOZ19_14240 [Rubrobacter sp.]|nr:hypothetical protein [Rubrobacter sp.]
MSKIRKLIIVGVVALMMMIVAVPPALAQGYYWNPAWIGGDNTSTPANTPTTTPSNCWQWGWYQDADGDWQQGWVWAC